jgi:hypothetical protein
VLSYEFHMVFLPRQTQCRRIFLRMDVLWCPVLSFHLIVVYYDMSYVLTLPRSDWA